MVTYNNLVFSISGAFDRAEILERLDEVSESLNARETQLPKTALPALSKSAHKFVEAQREQSHLAIGYRGISLSDPRRFAQQIMHAVLSGQGGRLFLNLRDKASLAYSVAPIHLEGIEGGFFGGYIGCSPEKVDKALEMLKIEFRKISTQLISADEMQRAKRYLIGRHDIGIQRNSAIAGAMLFDDVYGLPFDETFRYAERINAVTAKEVKDLAASIFEGPSVTSLIGRRDFSNP
jgi:zinc protease